MLDDNHPQESRWYGPRLGSIRPAQFQAALDRFDLGQFVEAEPVHSGLFGQNVFLTSTVGRWVLRGDPHYDWQFPTEEFFARLIHERTLVPVPWPYLRDTSTDIFGWEYVLMPRMPGLQIGRLDVRARLTSRDYRQLAYALAQTLAELHALEWRHPGRYTLRTGDITPDDDSWVDRVEADVRALVGAARSHSDWTTDADVAWVENLLAAGRQAIEEPLTARVVLPDYKLDNATAQRFGGRWAISGVFDLMEAFMGDGEMSLCRQFGTYLDEGQPALAGEYVRGYLTLRPSRPGFAERFRAYMLADRLIVWEYGQRHPESGWWKTRLTLREYIDPYLDAATDFR